MHIRARSSLRQQGPFLDRPSLKLPAVLDNRRTRPRRPPLEPPVAQPLSKLNAIARTASRRFQHLALDIIGPLRRLKAFGETSRSLAGPPKRQQEQEHCQRDGSVAQRRPHPWARGDPGEEPADHRPPPRFQSSSRA